MLLDDVMRAPEAPVKEQVLHFETRSLRNARALMGTVSMEDCVQFIEQNSHPR